MNTEYIEAYDVYESDKNKKHFFSVKFVLIAVMHIILAVGFFFAYRISYDASIQAQSLFYIKSTPSMTQVVAGQVTRLVDNSARINYITDDGEYYLDYKFKNRDCEVGEQIDVTYNPQNPAEATIYLSTMDTYVSEFVAYLTYIFLALSGLTACGVIVIIIRQFIKPVGRGRKKSKGVYIVGQ